MVRRAARVDDNQPAIVLAFQSAGATVQHLHAVAGGCPDILVGFRGVNYAVEIKDGSKPPSARKLTPPQVEWHSSWKGQVCVVESETQALNLLGLVPMRGEINE